MDAIIKIKLSELNAAFVEHLKALFQGKEDAELTLSVDENQSEYYNTLKQSKLDLEQSNNLTTFTLEELEAYSLSKRA